MRNNLARFLPMSVSIDLATCGTATGSTAKCHQSRRRRSIGQSQRRLSFRLKKRGKPESIITPLWRLLRSKGNSWPITGIEQCEQRLFDPLDEKFTRRTSDETKQKDAACCCVGRRPDASRRAHPERQRSSRHGSRKTSSTPLPHPEANTVVGKHERSLIQRIDRRQQNPSQRL